MFTSIIGGTENILQGTFTNQIKISWSKRIFYQQLNPDNYHSSSKNAPVHVKSSVSIKSNSNAVPT